VTLNGPQNRVVIEPEIAEQEKQRVPEMFRNLRSSEANSSQ
jgi:hypothetical protein